MNPIPPTTSTPAGASIPTPTERAIPADDFPSTLSPSSPPPAHTLSSDTPTRILEVAGQVFADVGYRHATVREICKLANANIAAVNYYFRDKDHLYQQVFQAAAKQVHRQERLQALHQKASTPEENLRAFIATMLSKVFDDGASNLHGRLMLREMIDPTFVLDAVVENEIRPFMLFLRQAVQGIIGPSATDEQITLGCNSVVGQILFYKHCKPVLDRLYPGSSHSLSSLQAHISTLSIAGLKALATHTPST